jgi:hypothetical protein
MDANRKKRFPRAKDGRQGNPYNCAQEGEGKCGERERCGLCGLLAGCGLAAFASPVRINAVFSMVYPIREDRNLKIYILRSSKTAAILSLCGLHP